MTRVDPRAWLRRTGLRPKKSFGQNFLVSQPIAHAIAVACVPDSEVGAARVVEIGAGTGALTHLLAERARTVAAIEKDRDLVGHLTTDLSGTRATVLQADAASADLGALLGPREENSARVLCGNLPYSMTGALLRRAVEMAPNVERVVFMVQEEVAARLSASPGTKDWGGLTVFVRAQFDVRRILRAPPAAFHPPPAVTSAVVELSPLRPPRAVETERFRSLVRCAFGTRRKTLRNAWARLAPDLETLGRAAAEAGIALDARGETLDVEAFASMAAALDALTGSR